MRVAIFVDAGYLYAGGLTALAGSNQPREYGELNLSKTVAKLRETAVERSDGASLLRIYWYDGMRRGQLSPEQECLAHMDDVKLRLGVVREGRQKGVDSLIVTDLIELARNHAISDAVLLAGDEDLRIGVQIAQSFGVRIHLLGIAPSRGNQSLLLLQEADTSSEWSKTEIAAILEFKPADAQWADAATDFSPLVSDAVTPLLDETVGEFLHALSSSELAEITVLQPNEWIPRRHDLQLVGRSKARLGRDLTEAEKRYVRNRLKERASAPPI